MKEFDLLAILLKPEFGLMLLHGIEATLQIAAGSWLLAMSIAILLLVVRLTGQPIAERAVAAYVSYHRNVPTLVQLMLWYFGIFSLLPDAVQAWLSNHNAESLISIIALGLRRDLCAGCGSFSDFAACCQGSGLLGYSRSSARLSSRTLTPGSPKKPS